MTAAPPEASRDRRLGVIAGVGIAISLVAGAARLVHLLPAQASTGVILIGLVIALRVALVYAGRSASSPARARTMRTVSSAGLALSAVTLLASLPHLTRHGGLGTFCSDTVGQLWALGALTIAAGPVRTIGWRGLVGAGLAGFLAVPGLSRLVARPLVSHFGTTSLPVVAGLVPVSEELFKALPVLLIVAFAVRRRDLRPAALDLVLVGAWSGAGFTLFEDASGGHGGAQFGSFPPFSWLLPSGAKESLWDSSYLSSGHQAHSALIALGIAVVVLYHGRIRWPWLWFALSVGAALGDHILNNAVSTGQLSRSEATPWLDLTLDGRLSDLLLLAGVGYLFVREGRSTGGLRPNASWLRLSAEEAARRGRLLALAQCGAQAQPSVQPSVQPSGASS
jgi:hypothetical protein